MNRIFLILFTLTLYTFTSCNTTTTKETKEIENVDEPTQTPVTNASLYSKENLVAWCIVPYDSKERNAEERAQMLKKLGISTFAYDWRSEHLPSMKEEIETMQKNNIKLQCIWFWVDGGGKNLLDGSNEKILKTLEDMKVNTTLWVSFKGEFFDGIDEEEKLQKGINAVKIIQERAEKIGCKIALYNHGDWFGEPENQIKIIEAFPDKEIGLIYNFHHAHQQIDRFAQLAEKMKPYLWCVNLNGIRPEGPKILPLGEGNKELEMLEILKKSGYNGPIGILGHTEGEDVELVLQRNLKGLQNLLKTMGDTHALKTYL